jgi:hypothetical protein
MTTTLFTPRKIALFAFILFFITSMAIMTKNLFQNHEVYINHSSKVYHMKKHCSRLTMHGQKVKTLRLEAAIENGFSLCPEEY